MAVTAVLRIAGVVWMTTGAVGLPELPVDHPVRRAVGLGCCKCHVMWVAAAAMGAVVAALACSWVVAKVIHFDAGHRVCVNLALVKDVRLTMGSGNGQVALRVQEAKRAITPLERALPGPTANDVMDIEVDH
jgi:hypothetical protein